MATDVEVTRVGDTMNTSFPQFWLIFGDKPWGDRRQYFCSLNKHQQDSLIKSFYSGGWDKFFVQIYIDYLLDQFKSKYKIDLIDVRIKAIKSRKVFLIDRDTWEEITNLILEWDDFYDADLIFGGLLSSLWGKEKRFYKIRARKHLHWR